MGTVIPDISCLGGYETSASKLCTCCESEPRGVVLSGGRLPFAVVN